LEGINAAIRDRDREVNAWVKQEEKEIVKEWNQERKQLKGMSVVP